MAGKRFSRIISATKYYLAVDNYIKYITDSTTRGANVGNGNPRPESLINYIRPFGIDLPTSVIVPVSGNAATLNARRGQTGGRLFNTTGANVSPVKPDGFRAARAVIATGRTAGVKKTSKITGLPYLSYGGSSTSVPFGRKDATDTEAVAFNEIKTTIQGAVSNSTVSHIKEKI